MNYSQQFKEHYPRTHADKAYFLWSRHEIEDVLNEYNYLLDTCMVKHKALDAWVDLFSDDCQLTYPFGTHHGKQGLAEWVRKAEGRFSRLVVCNAGKLSRLD